MATHKLGKLKFNLSREGLAFRMGEGKVHRLRLGKKSTDEALPPEGMDYEGDNYNDDYADGGYNGRFANRDDGFDDYADDGYEAEDDGYADEGDYGDGHYADEGDYADDGRDNRFDDDRYDDDRYDDERYDDEGYDDRYSDADAENYGGSYERDENAFLRFVDENDWVTYLLLVVLPPLGIYLLWRRRRFEPRIRWIVSAASAVWFIIMLILIISGISRGNDRSVVNSRIDLTTPTPTIAGLASASPEPSADTDISSLLDDISATATPLVSNNNGGATTNVGTVTVYMPATGAYYHSKADCENIDKGVSVSTVTEDVAIARGQTKCPLCFAGQTTYYATNGGSYYHVDQHCSDMTDAHEITESAAKAEGKTPCPVCITKSQSSLSDSDLKFVSSTTTDQSGISVYYTSGGRYFHTKSNCSGMTNPTQGSLQSALLAGKTACPVCAAAADNMVYATRGGTYYHSNATCSDMSGATRLTLAEAMVLGKKQCPKCWSGTSGSTSSSTSSSASSSTSIPVSGSDTSGVYVYGTQSGKYFHTKADCSGMTNAGHYTLKSMLLAGKKACPVCCKGADAKVYAVKGGTYYHSYATCSGMTDAQSGTLAEALAYGYKKCPKCWSGSASSTTSNTTNTTTESTNNSSGDYVYCTQSSKYYHTNSTCSGMTGASRVKLATAVSAGKTACPVCASQASRTVYSTTNGTYYHAKSSCTNMTNGKARTLEAALLLGQKACPICIGGSGTSNSTAGSNTSGTTLVSSGTYKAGTSGIKVYATADGKYYHAKSNCSGIVSPSYITLETALNYGKTACPVCASSANNTVYAVKGGKYYHYSKTCAGSGATSGTRAEALAYGLDPCPYCVTGTKPATSSGTYKAGTSGVKVYATVSGKYFHNDKSCAGSGASHIALETALNYGKTACPNCAAGASKTVYTSSGDKYFHISKSDAGSGAKAGTLAKAMALGKKPCPNCIGGSESHEESDVKYSAPGSTAVYIDLDSDLLYYHLAASCSDAGFSNGTKVTLKYVVDNKFWACPFCAPPTSVSD